ncbi:MAG: tetrathionate reductase family octaheme c-type cytochrome [Deltaproteobacteria bacterium]|nr:tetrathionate reductase family octaheme c-type cytochrome [Deltaproteobacteria bacterium]
MRTKFGRNFYILSLLGLFSLLFAPMQSFAIQEQEAPGLKLARQAVKTPKKPSTTDHSRLKALNQDFTSGSQISKACISCHTEAADQLKKTLHWTWIDPDSPADNPKGKAGYSLNNFCITTNGMNDRHCNKCHIGWNTEDKEAEIDCLKCHGQKKINWEETFHDYKYFAESNDPEEIALAKDAQVEIREAVQSIGRPTRKNCGSCHFTGGGGDGVKHGDLDSSLTHPNRELDVHMGYDGQNFECTRCHTTIAHRVAGRIYGTPASKTRKSLLEHDLEPKIMCESCHSDKPHKSSNKMNDHTDKVACQTCHVPEIAKVIPVQTWWDWSKAGKKKEGKPYSVDGPLGRSVYRSFTGETKWEKNVAPKYLWFNGSIQGATAKDIIDPGKLVKLAWPDGDRNDKNARIFPFNVHLGKQPYDTENKTMATPLFSGEHGYWATFDWQDSIQRGAEYLNLPFSGKIGFVETGYVFPSTHMVSPKEKALECNQCHTRPESRLANLTGFYMPGRDRVNPADIAGWAIVLCSFGGIVMHALGRIFTNGRKKEE